MKKRLIELYEKNIRTSKSIKLNLQLKIRRLFPYWWRHYMIGASAHRADDITWPWNVALWLAVGQSGSYSIYWGWTTDRLQWPSLACMVGKFWSIWMIFMIATLGWLFWHFWKWRFIIVGILYFCIKFLSYLLSVI